MRLLHLADLHLDASCSAFGPIAEARRTQVRAAFERLPETCEAESADAVLIAGDLFDGPQPAPDTRAAVRETLRRLREAGVPVFLIPGNHDALPLLSSVWADLRERAHLFEHPHFETPVSVETTAGPLHVYGIAHDPAEQPDPLTTFRRHDAAGVHVALLHGSVPDAPHWSASGNALRLPPDRLRSLDVDYIALGDYHRFRPPAEFDGVPACYAGSLAGLDLTESGPRGYVVVEVEPGGSPRVEHRSSGIAEVADLGRFDASGHASEATLADAIAERAPEACVPVVTLVGEPDAPIDAARVQTELAARFGYAAVTDETRYYDSAVLDEIAAKDTIAAQVVRLGRERIANAEPHERAAAERALGIALRALGVGA